MLKAPKIPSATYRLQFHSEFTFNDARKIIPYLADLGISDVYASPFFQASPSSTHGYDVADHNRINPAIGDKSEFQAFVATLRDHNMGLVLDFVPNHMGIGESLNKWWMEVLEDGLQSPYAQYFDIDWQGKEALANRVLLPILGDRYGKVLESGEFSIEYDGGGFFLKYFETRLPLNAASYQLILRAAMTRLSGPLLDALREAVVKYGSSDPDRRREAKAFLADLSDRNLEIRAAISETLESMRGTVGDPASFDQLHEVLERQSYRLSYWRVAAEEINYRRFFDINTLAAIRIEIPEVFEAAHRLVFELLERGDVTGLRIDHIDGLWDPKGYLDRVQSRFAEISGSKEEKGLYLLVEKILDLTREQLPAEWRCHGTTGYEFANQVVQVLTNKAAERKITSIYDKFVGDHEDFAELVYEKKKLTMQIALGSEVAALGRLLDELSEMHRHYRDLTQNMLTFAVREVIACFPVYRTYLTPEGSLSAGDEKVVLKAILAARRRNRTIEKSVFDFLRNLLLMRLPDYLNGEQREKHIRFVMKFQQCSGPVMAKGLEDTSFYIYNRLLALNEVGGDPGSFGISVGEFHQINAQRCESFPHSMLATSTHDTKRSEDVRMRLVAISEHPDLWKKSLQTWSKLNKKHRTEIDGLYAPSRNEEYLIYQSLLGVWPLQAPSQEELQALCERLKQYCLKALKEAKINSSWTEPNEPWEQAVDRFLDGILATADSPFLADVAVVSLKLAEAGATNSLTEVILKCTSPGVPDVYQGTEIWDLSLVDPDNRRPVDYAVRQEMLGELQGASIEELMKEWGSGAIKLFVLKTLLKLRMTSPNLFSGSYEPVEVSGPLAEKVIAFRRRADREELLVAVPRLTSHLGFNPIANVWAGTHLLIEDAEWTDVFDNRRYVLDGGRLERALELSPFAVLHRSW